MKTCKCCRVSKPFSEYWKKKCTGDGYNSRCKDCCREQFQTWWEANKESRREKKRQYDKEYREKNAERKRENDRLYRQRNLEKVRAYDRQRTPERRKDPAYKLMGNLRHRVWTFLRGKGKSKSTRELIGCSPQYLKRLLEAQFKPGMSWENYGEWQIDHVIPLSSIDRDSPEFENELESLCHYCNLQPLWKEENLTKSNKTI